LQFTVEKRLVLAQVDRGDRRHGSDPCRSRQARDNMRDSQRPPNPKAARPRSIAIAWTTTARPAGREGAAPMIFDLASAAVPFPSRGRGRGRGNGIPQRTYVRTLSSRRRRACVPWCLFCVELLFEGDFIFCPSLLGTSMICPLLLCNIFFAPLYLVLQQFALSELFCFILRIWRKTLD
jgi:hypothetical protein